MKLLRQKIYKIQLKFTPNTVKRVVHVVFNTVNLRISRNVPDLALGWSALSVTNNMMWPTNVVSVVNHWSTYNQDEKPNELCCMC